MAIERLKAKDLAKLNEKGMYADGGGLYLQVGEGGRSKSWLFRYAVTIMVDDKAVYRDRQMGLGPLYDVDIDAAREKARECRNMRREGIDPLEQRKVDEAARQLAAGQVKTFRECAPEYAKSKRGWTDRYRKQALRWLEVFAYPKIGNMPVSNIDAMTCRDLLLPIQAKAPPTAEGVRLHLHGTLDWAYAMRLRSTPSPASKAGPLGKLLPKISEVHAVEHHPAMAIADMPAFMAKLRAHKDQRGAHGAHDFVGKGRTLTGYCLEFIILTGVRGKQAINAKWEQFELERSDPMWTCPEAETKNRKKNGGDHIVPLSGAVLELLKTVKEAQKDAPSEYVFADKQGSPLKTGSVLSFMKRSLKIDPSVAHVHGFRTTFKSWGVENGYDREVTEKALHHKVGGVEGIYGRHAKLLNPRRTMMEDWARYCSFGPDNSGKVLTFANAK